MFYQRIATLNCPTCSSRTPATDYCQWCGKPLSLRVRAPTPEESAETPVNPEQAARVRSRRLNLKYHDATYEDPLLRELYKFREANDLKKTHVCRIVGYPGIFEELHTGRKLRPVTVLKIRIRMAEYGR